jgi:hypothetical protein
VSLVSIKRDGPKGRGKGCSLGRWALNLPPEEAAALQGMLTDRLPSGRFVWSAAKLSKQVTDDPDYDLELSLQVVQRHRTGACSCGTR